MPPESTMISDWIGASWAPFSHLSDRIVTGIEGPRIPAREAILWRIRYETPTLEGDRTYENRKYRVAGTVRRRTSIRLRRAGPRLGADPLGAGWHFRRPWGCRNDLASRLRRLRRRRQDLHHLRERRQHLGHGRRFPLRLEEGLRRLLAHRGRHLHRHGRERTSQGRADDAPEPGPGFPVRRYRGARRGIDVHPGPRGKGRRHARGSGQPDLSQARPDREARPVLLHRAE